MNPQYTLHHPKWYRPRMPVFWWLRHFAYARFISRELTSLAVGYAAVFLLVYVGAITRGEAAYARIEYWLRQPAVVALHAIVLLGLVGHTISWLNLAPRALVLRLAGRKVPDSVILVAHYAAWAIVSAAMIRLLAGA